jgi:hypothetical protein
MRVTRSILASVDSNDVEIIATFVGNRKLQSSLHNSVRGFTGISIKTCYYHTAEFWPTFVPDTRFSYFA